MRRTDGSRLPGSSKRVPTPAKMQSTRTAVGGKRDAASSGRQPETASVNVAESMAKKSKQANSPPAVRKGRVYERPWSFASHPVTLFTIHRVVKFFRR